MTFKDLYNALVAKGFATAEDRAKLSELAGSDDKALELMKNVDTLPTEQVNEDDVQKQLSELLAKSTAEIKTSLEKEMKVKMDAWVKEQKELMTKRAGLYNPEIKAARKEQNVKMRKFLSALMVNDHSVLKDLSSGTDNKGGYLVDSQLEAEVQHLVTQYGIARREMTVVTLSKGDLKLNNLATDINVYWTDEAAAKTSSDVTLGQVTLALKKISVIVPMTDELLEDEEFDIVGFLQERIAEGMAKKEDQAFANGDGTSTYGSFTGFLQNAGVNVVTMAGSTFSSIDADDLIDMQDATPQGALANAKYHLHRTILSYIRKLKDTTGQYVYQPASNGSPATLCGYPVVLWEAFPAKGDTAAATAFVAFGDLRKACWLGTKGGLTVAISNEATVRNTAASADINLFRQDMTALRVVERVGYVVVIASAITVLKTAAASA
ncbi:MAG: phage major capsid protein [Candidatus Paceibacterota bacterium]